MTALRPASALLSGTDAVAFVRTFAPDPPLGEFVSRAWILAAWQHLSRRGEPCVLVAADRHGRSAVALTVDRFGPGAPRALLAGAPLGDVHDVFLSGPSPADRIRVLAAGLEELSGGGVHVTLDALADGGLLQAEVARRSPRWNLEAEPAPVIPLDRITVSERDHDRRFRRLARLGTPSVSVREGPALSAAQVTAFVRRRLTSWEARGRLGELPAIERSPGFPAFLGAAVAALAQQGLGRLFALQLDGVPIAESLHLGPPADPLMYMISYNPALAVVSPGRLLFERTLLDLRRGAVPRLRTGRGDEAYKLAAGAVVATVITARSTGRPVDDPPDHEPSADPRSCDAIQSAGTGLELPSLPGTGPAVHRRPG